MFVLPFQNQNIFFISHRPYTGTYKTSKKMIKQRRIKLVFGSGWSFPMEKKWQEKSCSLGTTKNG